jgi:hypothetical protein
MKTDTDKGSRHLDPAIPDNTCALVYVMLLFYQSRPAQNPSMLEYQST